VNSGNRWFTLVLPLSTRFFPCYFPSVFQTSLSIFNHRLSWASYSVSYYCCRVASAANHSKEKYPRMKRLLVFAIGLGLVLGTVSFAQDSTDKKMTKKKTGKKKKTDGTEATTTK
jgi:hypothetical protein